MQASEPAATPMRTACAMSWPSSNSAATLARGEVPAMVGLRLFLPDSWTADPERMQRAGVPAEFQAARTKPEIAIEEINRLRAAGLRFGRELHRIVALRGRPAIIVSEHGPELTSHAMLRWQRRQGALEKTARAS